MKSPFLLAACALAPFMAASQMVAFAAPAVPSFDPAGFELRETKAFSIAVEPAASLGEKQNLAQGTAPYRLVPGGIVLSSEARKPTAYHARQPRTELSEIRPWRVQDASASLDTTIHIDRFPKRGSVILAELGPDDDNAPVMRILVDGDRIVLRGQINEATANGMTLGTLDSTHSAHILLQTRPDGLVGTEINGTQSQFHLAPKALAIPVMFRTGAHVVDDIGTTPDQVVVTLTGLSARHGVASSRLRS